MGQVRSPVGTGEQCRALGRRRRRNAIGRTTQRKIKSTSVIPTRVGAIRRTRLNDVVAQSRRVRGGGAAAAAGRHRQPAELSRVGLLLRGRTGAGGRNVG